MTLALTHNLPFLLEIWIYWQIISPKTQGEEMKNINLSLLI